MYRTTMQIRKMCKGLSNSKGDKFDIDVTINSRLRTTLGRVLSTEYTDGTFEPLELQISEKLLLNATDEEIDKVIKHEWVHYYLLKTTAKNHTHDSIEFIELAEEVGGSTGATTEIESYTQTYKYIVKCPCCGKEYGYNRKCKIINDIEHYSCSICGNKNLIVNQMY